MSNKTFKKVSVVKLSANFAEATKVVEVPLIPPNDNQVLLKNLYAGVNATDINISAGRYFTDGKIPFDVGLEVFRNNVKIFNFLKQFIDYQALGVIEAVGKNVTTLKVGQPAIVFGVESKGYAEYLVIFYLIELNKQMNKNKLSNV